MLRVHPSASAAQAKRYFADGLHRGDYYHADDAPGQWYGRGAALLGLAGDVAREAFFALLDNRRPDGSDERLTARDKGPARRCGTDVVFSPPKAVSVLRALTGDERIGEALRESVAETLDDIEREAITTRLRRSGQKGAVGTGNAVFALFTHDTTRALEDGRPDPHDHIHAYLLNATFAEHEKRWQAIDAVKLHTDRPYYEAAFEARLAKKLTALGYEIERTASGWTLAGVPDAVTAKTSRRTAEIEAEARRLGVTDPDRKGELGAKIRRPKSEPLPADELRAYWRAKLTPSEQEAVAATHRRAVEGGPAVMRPASAAEAVTHAVDHLFARASVVPLRQLETAALKFGVGAVTPEAVAAELSRRNLVTAERGGEVMATTGEAVAQERAIIRFAMEGRGSCDPLGGYGEPRPIGRAFLNASQRKAVRHLLDSFDRVQILRGKAGVGKSTVMGEIRDGIEAAGGHVLAVAPTAGAAEVLAHDGFRAETVARLLVDKKLQQELRGSVLVVDEAGLIGVPTMHKLFTLVEQQGARVILAGDTLQHRPVERGAALKLLEERAGLRAATLDTIIRQTQAALRDAVATLARGRGGEGFDQLERLGAVAEIADPDARYRALAREYADALVRGKDVLAIAPTHAEGAQVTAAIRAELRARERLGVIERAVTGLESAQLTDAERRDAARYQAGQVIAFTQNAKGGWRRGERATVLGRDESGLRVRSDAGEERHVPLALADKFQVFRTRALFVAEGDRLRFTQNLYRGKSRLTANGAVATVTGFTRDGIVLDNGLTLDTKQAHHVAPGWVVTSVASQGKTVKGTVFVAQAQQSLPAVSAEQLYVSASRARDGVRIFTDDTETLRCAVSRPERTASAIELAEARQPRPTDHRARHAQFLERLKYLAMAAAASMRDFGRTFSVAAQPALTQWGGRQ